MAKVGIFVALISDADILASRPKRRRFLANTKLQTPCAVKGIDACGYALLPTGVTLLARNVTWSTVNKPSPSHAVMIDV